MVTKETLVDIKLTTQSMRTFLPMYAKEDISSDYYCFEGKKG